MNASETWLEPHHVVLICSKRRKGKSTLAQVFASYMTSQRVVLADVKRRYAMPGAYVAHGIAELAACPADALRVHFVPVAVDGPSNRNAVEQEWDAFFAWCFNQPDVTVLLDECVPMPAPSDGRAPGMLVKYVGQGAATRCGLIACTGRWRGVLTDLKSHANLIVIFPGGLSVDELEDAAREMNLGYVDDQTRRKVKPLDELRSLLKQAEALGEYACVMYDRDRDSFRIFEVPEHLLERAVAREVAPA